MDNNAKVILSEGELAMATDKNIILTKRAIIEKTAALFEDQCPTILKVFSDFFNDAEIPAASFPKISKGENYKELPYVIMDYPATFKRDHIFAVRTMFWWGNFISITLHLKGIYKKRYFTQILEKLQGDKTFFISVSDEEWAHDFEPGNFKKISSLTMAEKDGLQKINFVKLALKYELHHWNMMQSILPEGYKKIVEIISS